MTRLRALARLCLVPGYAIDHLHHMRHPDAVKAWRWAWRQWVHEHWHGKPRESFGGWGGGMMGWRYVAMLVSVALGMVAVTGFVMWGVDLLVWCVRERRETTRGDENG
jgi:hypothetical protein